MKFPLVPRKHLKEALEKQAELKMRLATTTEKLSAVRLKKKELSEQLFQARATPPPAPAAYVPESLENPLEATVNHNGVKAVFATPTAITRQRAESLFTKEPITMEWIATFKAGDVLVDCGANVGMYTIWSAVSRGVRVSAFEPESQNYAMLNRNIFLNGLGATVKAYCAALSDHSGLDELHLSRFQAGGSCHSLGDKVDFNLRPMQPSFTQGCISMCLDDLVGSGKVEQPNHLKIDVDGFEAKVVVGAKKVIADPRLQSLLIEVNPTLAEHQAMVACLLEAGFSYDSAQVSAAERLEGPFKGMAEYVFRR